MNTTAKWPLIGLLLGLGIALGSAARAAGEPAKTLRGVCFSPYRINQSPDCGVHPTSVEIREELEFLKQSGFASRIRTYSSLGRMGEIPSICQDLGLECWPGAWLSRHKGPTERELRALIAVGNKRLPRATVLIVGNEVLLRNDMTEQALVEAIRRVKRETGAQVAYAEIGDVWTKHPRVAEAVDVILVHLYPYWENKPIGEAVGSLVGQWQGLVRAFPGKRIAIGETGWPSAGEVNGAAVPSDENHARYFREFLEASRAHNIDYFYFALFSEAWKAKDEGARGAHWGLFTAEGSLKPGLADLVSPAAASGMKRPPGAIPPASPLSLPAYVYRDGDADQNRFYPTGWMGDSRDLQIDEYCTQRPCSGAECLRIDYSPRGPEQWAAIYWVGPYMNHWGRYPGYVVRGAKKLVFSARGAKGGENVEFKIGGIDSPGQPFRDSFGPLPVGGALTTLTSQWTQYSIDLAGTDTSSLLGGFCIAVNAPGNPGGATFYLDEIVLVADHIPPPLPVAKTSLSIVPGPIGVVPQEIAAAQSANVRESSGTYAHECFTDDDYAAFAQGRVADKIAAALLDKPGVQAAILTLRMVPAAERETALRLWRRPLHKTWGELGRISREGQTEAGQKAEIDIANAIANALLAACRDPQWRPVPADR